MKHHLLISKLFALTSVILIAIGCENSMPTPPTEVTTMKNNEIGLTVSTPQDANFAWILASSNYAPPSDMPFGFFVDGQGDMGVQFVDVDWDGRKDLVYNRYLGPNNIQKGAYKNTGSGWTRLNDQFAPPYIMHNDLAPAGQRNFAVAFVDVDNDGHEDMLYYRILSDGSVQKGAFRNTGNGWSQLGSQYEPQYHLYVDGYGDMGVKFVDVDHDGKKDMIYSRYGTTQIGAYRNTGSGWQSMGNQFYPPYHLYADRLGDMGVAFVDVNGDRYEDLVYYRYGTTQIGTWINTGSGWSQASSNYNVPYHLFVDLFPLAQRNMAVKFVDLDRDGKKDMIYYRYGTTQIGAYKNTGSGWQAMSANYYSPYHFYADGLGDMAVKFVDIDGDGDEDMLCSRWGYPDQYRAYFNHCDVQASIPVLE